MNKLTSIIANLSSWIKSNPVKAAFALGFIFGFILGTII